MSKLDTLQEIQNRVFRLRDTYTSGSHQFAALTLAWEAIRFAWYAVNGDYETAADKLDLVKRAVEDCDW